MEIKEQELEDFIFKNHNQIKGLNGNYIVKQVLLKGYGILDLLIISIENSGNETFPVFKIVELKQNDINLNTIGQISRYYTALKRNLENINYPNKNTFPIIELILIGKEIELNGDSCFLINLLNNLEIKVITYNLSLEKGITFKNENEEWYKKDEKTNYNLEKFIKKALTNSKIWQKED